MDEAEFVNVAIRIRPGDQHSENQPCLQIINKNPPILLIPDRSQTYSFDQVFDGDANQKIVYEQTVKPFVKYVKQGYNCTVFAYGQTGTGKTYTIGTESQVVQENCLGLIPRTLREFFNSDDNYNKYETEIFVSFIEIYNERVFDLLQDNSNPPLIIKGMKPQGICQEKVYNLTDARHFLNMGNKNRHTAGTKQNAKSSRSHAIFTIHCNVRNKDTETKAKLNLVDLAGCESVKKTGNQGSTFHEGVNINKGLLSISQVMIALSTNAAFIPYRQSVITSVLQDSLNKRNFISLIACVSSLQEDTTETLQTLDFAQRLKKVKSRPELNEVIAQFKKDNPTLFQTTRIGATPFKRPMINILQTPAPTKRLKPLEMDVTEMNSINSEQSHTPKSLLSFSRLSAVSSMNPDITQQALSPVIKKYMSAMEASLMDKLEVMIKSSLKRPSPALEFHDEKENKNCTPNMNWSRIHNEVSKMVQSEMIRLTTKSVQVTSSPIEDENMDRIRKVLTYDSSATETSLKAENTTLTRNSFSVPEFKIPELPTVKSKKIKRKSKISLSPIEIIAASPRRSMRLSLKKIDISQEGIASFRDSGNFDISHLKSSNSRDSIGSTNRRKSVRLAEKRKSKKLDDDDCNNNIRKTKAVAKRNNIGFQNTPARKRLMEENQQDSPCTAHTKKVLNTLKNGSLRELEKLQLLGSKTAQQVVLFREIKGNLNKISDLLEMPGWGEKKFKRFVDQNFLKMELLSKDLA